MKKVMMQYENDGEWFEIWNTSENDLEKAWEEIDNQPTEGGRIKYEGTDEFLTVNRKEEM